MKKPIESQIIQDLNQAQDQGFNIGENSWGSYTKQDKWGTGKVLTGKTVREWIQDQFDKRQVEIIAKSDIPKEENEYLAEVTKVIKITDINGIPIYVNATVFEALPIPEIHTLTLMNNGTIYREITINHGETVNLSEYILTMPDYNFEGWYTADTGGTQITTWTANADLTLYARWTYAAQAWFFGSNEQLSDDELIANKISANASRIPGTITKSIITLNYYVIVPTNFSIRNITNAQNFSYLQNFEFSTKDLGGIQYKIYKMTRAVAASIELTFKIEQEL